MKRLIILHLLIIFQSVFPQSNQLVLDGKYFHYGNSSAEIKEIFNSPMYIFSTDSISHNFKETYLFKANEQELKFLGLFSFVGDKLFAFKKAWLFSTNKNLYYSLTKIYYALKINYNKNYNIKIDFKEENEPNFSSKSLILSNGEKDIELKLMELDDKKNIVVSEFSSKKIFDINKFEKSYYLIFFDYKKILGNRKIISEFYNSLDKARRRLRELSYEYIIRELPVNGSILSVVLPKE